MTVLSQTQFQLKLSISGYSLELSENLISSRAFSGQSTVSQIGPRFWKGSLTIVQNSHSELLKQISLVRQIMNSGMFFTFTPPEYTSVSTTGTTPIMSSPVAGYSLTITGLPGSLSLKNGDYFSYSSGGVHRLHQIATDTTATVAGVATVSLVNPIRVNSIPANGTAVLFNKPLLTCRYSPGSLRIGGINPGYSESFSFDFEQTFVVG